MLHNQDSKALFFSAAGHPAESALNSMPLEKYGRTLFFYVLCPFKAWMIISLHNHLCFVYDSNIFFIYPVSRLQLRSLFTQDPPLPSHFPLTLVMAYAFQISQDISLLYVLEFSALSD